VFNGIIHHPTRPKSLFLGFLKKRAGPVIEEAGKLKILTPGPVKKHCLEIVYFFTHIF
jgi:hypothetical protein